MELMWTNFYPEAGHLASAFSAAVTSCLEKEKIQVTTAALQHYFVTQMDATAEEALSHVSELVRDVRQNSSSAMLAAATLSSTGSERSQEQEQAEVKEGEGGVEAEVKGSSGGTLGEVGGARAGRGRGGRNIWRGRGRGERKFWLAVYLYCKLFHIICLHRSMTAERIKQIAAPLRRAFLFWGLTMLEVPRHSEEEVGQIYVIDSLNHHRVEETGVGLQYLLEEYRFSLPADDRPLRYYSM
eukprot:scaffold3521_cov268-Ochromonas_danica.AAC.1